MPTCWIIAGPNGAGKTTFALEYLPQIARCRHFINADLIAAGLSPLAPEQQLVAASRLFLREIEHCIEARQDFAFETTLAGRSYLRLIRELQADGWRVELIYLALPSVEMSRMRVAERVAHGGHDIPAEDISRRFPRSLYNLFHLFSPLVDENFCLFHEHRYESGSSLSAGFDAPNGFSSRPISAFTSADTPMNAQLPPIPDEKTQAILNCLQQAVSKALERKRRLGHYAVFWDGVGPVAVGEDAPPSHGTERKLNPP